MDSQVKAQCLVSSDLEPLNLVAIEQRRCYSVGVSRKARFQGRALKTYQGDEQVNGLTFKLRIPACCAPVKIEFTAVPVLVMALACARSIRARLASCDRS